MVTTAVAMGIVAMDGMGAVIGALGDSNAAIGRRTSGAPSDQSSRLGVISDDSSRASVGQASLCANRKWNEQSNVCGRAGPSFPRSSEAVAVRHWPRHPPPAPYGLSVGVVSSAS